MRFPEFTGEWKLVQLSQIADFVGGGTPSSSNASFWNGSIPWISSSDIKDGNIYDISITRFITKEAIDKSTTKLCPAPVILLVSRVGVGKVALSNKKLCTSQDFCNLINIKCNPNFLAYDLVRTMKQKSREAQGTSIKGVTSYEIQKIRFWLPEKKKEQDKIATFLSLLDHRIATQNKIIEKYESLIKGINEKLLINKKEYTTYRLSDICEIRSGYSGTQLTGTQGLMVSRIETISKHCINLDKVGYVKPFDSSADFKLHIGDILFSNINSVQYIGNTAFVDREYDLYHGMNLLRLIPRKIVEPFYVFLLLNTAKYKIHFQSICNKAISQASINQTELGKTVIHIPDLLYQKQICQLYNSLYNKKNIENLYLQALKQQKNHLLRQMVI
ncbi:restriction endonuclease subunit S [Bacteroides xylanisolvens]|uniref:restriction endonuclease subunit S n=1 Tax=Bacteroides xylanisolvens TaxID=371601 RepID=UPI0010DF1851|nr:restriction endonuclease subunit S [Bacteroides xylanisolvens]KAB6097164.1 restriction endonuclease subunit S [Bacteroides xylanisolvens]KAB6109697.1 restriction endonuclease subunit S [Bacteroides xylanisolvens]RYT18740.1 restriction endonuclease subunit S [Bacteroides xylanisolvens]